MTGNTNQTQPSTQRKPDLHIEHQHKNRNYQQQSALITVRDDTKNTAPAPQFLSLCPAKAIDDLVTSTPHFIQPHCPAAGLHQRL